MGLKPMVIFVWDGSGAHPDHSLPPGLGGVDPGYGVEAPVDPGFGVPGRPARPDQGLPGGRPPRPDQSLPPIPVEPTQPIAPGQPGAPTTLPAMPTGAYLVIWAPGKGYVAVELGAKPDQSLPGGQPPAPQPKR